MLGWLELAGAIWGDAGPEGARRGAELGVLDERRAQPVVGEEEPVVGRPVLTHVPAGIEQTRHTVRKLQVAPHKGFRRTALRRPRIQGQRYQGRHRVVVDAEPGRKSDVGGQAPVRERARRYGPDPVSQLLRRTAFRPLGECALTRVGIEAGRTDGRIGGDARGHHGIKFAATGGNPPVSGVVDEVARPVPALIDRFENVWQVVEVLFGAVRADRVPDVEVLGRAPSVVRTDRR